jgi:sulfite reductase alpha subunit-like flavoprotein
MLLFATIQFFSSKLFTNFDIPLKNFCRDATEDMFADETAKIVQRKVAFSRIYEDHKVYVQDLIEKNAAKVYDLIANHQAHFFICGKVTVLSF